MHKIITFTTLPELFTNDEDQKQIIATETGVDKSDITEYRILRKSVDARRRPAIFNIKAEVWVNEEPENLNFKLDLQDVSEKTAVHVIGSGPAGLFGALELIQQGLKPIIWDRGNNVSARKRDIANISREHELNEDSNYAFGEGGAGTFSDGKLYTRSKKRGNIENVLSILNHYGANDNILFEAHPHIGSDKLPKIVERIREAIIKAGGEVNFGKKLTNLEIENNTLTGIFDENNELHKTNALLLATGHSANDIYYMLQKNEVDLEMKPFAVGVRVEHPQELIDSIQYKKSNTDFLPAATYSLACQVDGRGVFSFCMCPGGFIVPASTAKNEMVVNGMSASQRNSPFANAGIVTEVRAEDLEEYKEHGALAGLKFRESIEQMSFLNGGRGFQAPAQRLTDFVKGRISQGLPGYSYFPGLTSSPIHHWLPEFISKRLQQGFINFERKMRGFVTNEAIVVGIESRTSSPVRIPRDRETFEHINIKGLFPAGEGSGYAGGIVSSAIDGQNSAKGIAQSVNKN